ncbi:hypothetical protein [Actinophytocola sp.]|uniref:hypothetical protein n=1 Tax=Actinophytocola sp. TaxID=1872138 RepID=UPI002D7E9890|nr:hypothetical protein [Actinophytocola sp.]HET9143323.1 hypothetical protein [Actinophytocola sp.]HEU5110544.1 hypothetical protein [Micromonosporaceae bacterium]
MGVRWRLVAVSAAMMALLGACSSGSGGPGNGVASLSDPAQPSNGQQADDGKTDEDRMREFAGCMREHGIDMEDPKSGPDGGGISIEVNGDNEGKMKEADEACRHLMPNGGQPPKLDAAQLDKLREQAKCLRDHGLNVKDPDPNNPGIMIEGSGPDQKEFEEAHKACNMEGPGGVFGSGK